MNLVCFAENSSILNYTLVLKKNRYEELYQNHDRVEQTSFFLNDLIFLNSSFCLLKKLYFLSVRQCEQDPCIWVSIIMPGSLDV